MPPVVVVKLGGGLITEKASMTTVHEDRLNRLAREIAAAARQGVRVLVVHGAGSFGHLRAKAWRLSDGRSDAQGNDGCANQDEAVERVREDMMLLAEHVTQALHDAGLATSMHPPHRWAVGLGTNFVGDLQPLQPGDVTPVTWGDVVPVEGPAAFGILSGDDLVHRCAVELPNVSRVVFAMGGADGVLRKPPHEATEEDLIEVWHDAADFVGVHAADMDVTGGIGLKVQRARSIAQHGIETWFVNGEVEGRLEAAMLGRPVRGTRFPPAQKG
ncbi:MAG: isopentenyl phosphate kinase [Candidatus Thermoplasmatota archaeon]|nr:isopentenyl phosphate kinase [Candidatus Thermoplasmatota archaeon]